MFKKYINIKTVLIIIVFWLVFNLALLAAYYLDSESVAVVESWEIIGYKTFSIRILWILTTIGLYIWYQKYPIKSDQWVKHILTSFVLSILWFTVYYPLTVLVHYIFNPYNLSFMYGFKTIISISYFISYMLYWTVVFAVNFYLYHQRIKLKEQENAQLQIKLLNTRLSLFHSQLEPHFLFNVLNSISYLVKQKQDAAVSGLAQLSDLLRHVITVNDKQWVSFKNEWAFTQNYITLQKLRFGEKLVVNTKRINMKENDQLPVMLFQPAIENAINHGTLNDGKACEIQIVCEKKNGQVLLQIANPIGKSKRPDGTGLGLENLSQRLNALFGTNYDLSNFEQEGMFHFNLKFPVTKHE